MFRNMLFMVDEASMISTSQNNTMFGSGCLLDDLIQYIYNSGGNCRLLLIGDKAQLPPVGEQESPALRFRCTARIWLTCLRMRFERSVTPKSAFRNIVECHHHSPNDFSEHSYPITQNTFKGICRHLHCLWR